MTDPTPFELVNRRGETVRGVYQQGDGGEDAARPLVVMSTAFGQTFRKYLSAAAFFSGNGWDVVRYDILNTTSGAGCESSKASITPAKYGIRSFRQGPGSAAALPDNRRYRAAHSAIDSGRRGRKPRAAASKAST